MKRSRAPSALGAQSSQTVTTTVVKKPRTSIPRPPASRNLNNVRMGQGFPKKLSMTHRFDQIIALNTQPVGAYSVFHLSANGLFDPSITGGAHQPLYFKELAAIYDHYTVIGSKITVKVAKTDAFTNIPVIVGCYINDDSTAGPTGVLAMMEHPSATHKLVQASSPTAQFSLKWSAKKTFGGSVLGNDNLQGTATANPTEQSVYTLFIDSSVNATQTSVLFTVEIEYIAVWDELRDIVNT